MYTQAHMQLVNRSMNAALCDCIDADRQFTDIRYFSEMRKEFNVQKAHEARQSVAETLVENLLALVRLQSNNAHRVPEFVVRSKHGVYGIIENGVANQYGGSIFGATRWPTRAGADRYARALKDGNGDGYLTFTFHQALGVDIDTTQEHIAQCVAKGLKSL